MSQTLNQSLSQIITSITSVVGILIMMLTINWQMTLVALLTVPITIVVINVIVKISQKYFMQQQTYLGHVNGHVEEMFGGHIVVKAFNAEEKSVRTFNELNETLYSSAYLSQFLSTVIMPIMRFISTLAMSQLAFLAATTLSRGRSPLAISRRSFNTCASSTNRCSRSRIFPTFSSRQPPPLNGYLNSSMSRKKRLIRTPRHFGTCGWVS